MLLLLNYNTSRINVTAATAANITANNVYSLSVEQQRYWRVHFYGISTASTGTINIQGKRLFME
jgi:hypothetical protein